MKATSAVCISRENVAGGNSGRLATMYCEMYLMNGKRWAPDRMRI